jgi:hypothetical protein
MILSMALLGLVILLLPQVSRTDSEQST